MIPEFDMRVLTDIVDSESGWLREELYQKYGAEISETLDLLLEKKMVKIHERDLAPFLIPNGIDYKDPPKGSVIPTKAGKIEVRRWKEQHALSLKQKWKERIYGALFTLAIWVIQELITYYTRL